MIYHTWGYNRIKILNIKKLSKYAVVGVEWNFIILSLHLEAREMDLNLKMARLSN